MPGKGQVRNLIPHSMAQTTAVALALAIVVLFVAVAARAQNPVPPTAREAGASPAFASKLHPSTPPAAGKMPAQPWSRRASPQGTVLYENGPVNGTTDAWTINYGYIVSDTFTLGSASTVTGFDFYTWEIPGDVLRAVQWSITSSPNGGTVYGSGTVSGSNLTDDFISVNQYGYDIDKISASGLNVSLSTGTFWFNLQNASVPSGDPIYWDENSGAGCHSPGCPSKASENYVGTIPSEAFDITSGSPCSQSGENMPIIRDFTAGDDGGSPWGVVADATAIASPTQVLFITLHSFAGSDGAGPWAGLVQASDGNFYGTTKGGGAYGNGTVFKITPSGALTTLYSFCAGGFPCPDGASPEAGLVQASDGNFYGTTYYGGANYAGTVFKITPSGTETTLHSFNGSDGAAPGAGLVQASDGNFYGTTASGGGYGNGTIFKITPSGALTSLYSFGSQYYDGVAPEAGLVQGSDGNLYGTTTYGGYYGGAYECKTYGCGAVFKSTLSGALTTVHIFEGYPCDGANPEAGLVQGTNGGLYGTTAFGGANLCSHAGYGCGTVFGPGTLFSFYGSAGIFPSAGLVQGSDGNFYGTTYEGGASGGVGDGTVFRITPSGALTTLHSFAGSDGANPLAGLVQASDGNFYGTTAGGGAYGAGTVFRLVSVRPCFSCPLHWK